MAILNYTTQIDAEKSISEIQKCLVKHGATKIVTDYKDTLPCAVTFSLMLNGNMIFFQLPANYDGVLKSMQREKKVPNRLKTKEQALKVSWRIIKDWVEAQCAIIEAGLANIEEVFLPYAITITGETLYQYMQKNNQILAIGQ